MSSLKKISKEILSKTRNAFSSLSKDIEMRVASNESFWQKTNTSIADVLRDSSSVYAKLSKLQGDFEGKDAENISEMAKEYLSLTDRISEFSSKFKAGEIKVRENSPPSMSNQQQSEADDTADNQIMFGETFGSEEEPKEEEPKEDKKEKNKKD